MDYNLLFMCNFNDSVKEGDFNNDYLKRIWRCKWCLKDLETNLHEWLTNINNLESLTVQETEIYLAMAIEMLLIFIQNNFTGPFADLEQWQQFCSNNSFLKLKNATELQENGEEINLNVKLCELLLTAKEILHKLLHYNDCSLILHWWYLRCLCVQQHIIDELTANLYEGIKMEIEWLLQHIKRLQNKEYEALLYIEIGNAYLQYQRSEKCGEILNDLCKHLKVRMVVEGFLGVRTKFQQKPLPQLCLKVEQCNDIVLCAAKETNGATQLPKLLLLEDDTRLERIRFIDPKDNEVLTLPSILQALVLAKVRQLKRSTPKERLADEQLEPYVQTLLYQVYGSLPVRQASLLFNCVQENKHRRTVERSWKQCEQMVKLLSEFEYRIEERLSYCFSAGLAPKWQIQQQLCDLLLSLGMVKTALDIYLDIQNWEGVIYCYTRMELKHKAAEIIRQELEKKPTVLLYCLLGDATDDTKYYEKAWEFSQHTSGKAHAHWGYYHFERKQYEDALPHLQKSVEINSLQEKVWLHLGYTAIMLQQWQLAVHAYITYTHLEPLGFESWNNLAKALVKLGDKARAHKVLSESLKCNFHNWKVWENFMLVSVDTGHFEDAINAYNRLSELKIHFLDLEVLCVVMNALAMGKPDAGGQSEERLIKKAISLIGQQCIKHGSEPKVWELAALVAQTPLKKAELLVRALRLHTTKEPAWTTKEPIAQKVLQLCQHLNKYSLEAIKQAEAKKSTTIFNSITSQLSSARMATMACLKAIEKEPVKFPQHEPLIDALLILIEEITANLKERINK